MKQQLSQSVRSRPRPFNEVQPSEAFHTIWPLDGPGDDGKFLNSKVFGLKQEGNGPIDQRCKGP